MAPVFHHQGLPGKFVASPVEQLFGSNATLKSNNFSSQFSSLLVAGSFFQQRLIFQENSLKGQSWKMSNLLHGPISTNQLLPREKRVNRDIFGTSNLQNRTYGVSCDE